MVIVLPSKQVKKGQIFIVCPHCGHIYGSYVLGDKYNKDKFSGAPSPIRAFAKFDIRVSSSNTTIYCERCGHPIRITPRKVVVMKMKTFDENFIYDRVDGRIMRIKQPSLLENLVGEKDLTKDITLATDII